jgi:hypothetical protein
MRKIPRAFWFLFILFCALMSMAAAHVTAEDSSMAARTIFVTMSGNDTGDGSALYPVRSIGRAIGIASYGDTVSIGAGVYNTTGDGDRIFDTSIRLTGAGPEQTIIDGMNQRRIFTIGTLREVLIDNLTITGGHAERGGGILISYGNVRFSNTVISNNSADFGGGVMLESGTAEFIGCRISNNTALHGGGGMKIEGAGRAAINGSEISGNTAGYGGGISQSRSGGVGIWRSKITGNRALSDGGGIFISYGNGSVSCSVIADNDAGGAGGAIAVDHGKVRVTSSKIVNNKAVESGSGIATYGIMSDLVAVNNIFYNNDNVDCLFIHRWKRGQMECIGGGACSMPRAPSVSITGSRYTGGNAWARPDGNDFSQTCTDTDADGICDSPYHVFEILSDEHPLVFGRQGAGSAPNYSLPCDADVVPRDIPVHYTLNPIRILGETGALTWITLSLPFLAVLFLFLYFWKLQYW